LNIYYNNRDGDKVRVFISVRENEVTGISTGNLLVPTNLGIQIFVDNHVAEQIHKFDFIMDGLTPKLRLREGETLDIPEKTERELEIERLKYELEKLQNEDELLSAD